MRLTTERLLLREFELDDWEATHEYERDPVVVRYQTSGPCTPEESREYIRHTLALARERPRRTFDLAVVRKGEARPIGRCGLQVARPDVREGVLWYVLNRKLWGQGYIPEAAAALLDYGFHSLGLHRIIADIDPANRASERVLEKLGMRREAHFRENAWIKGEWCDSVIYALLDREWRPRPP